MVLAAHGIFTRSSGRAAIPKTDQTKPALPEKDAKELDRLVALWIGMAGLIRPQAIVDDTELENLLARILDAIDRYTICEQ